MTEERAPQVRNICFTIFSEGEHDPLRLLDLSLPCFQHVKYLVYQLEMCPETLRLHFQGYMELTQPKTYAALHLLDGFRTAHFEKRRGTAKQAANYCKKEDSRLDGPWELGECSQQGVRADLLEVKSQIDKGVSLKRIAADPDTFPTWIKFPKNWETYKRITTQPRRTKPLVILFVGPSGCGKTRTACLIGRMLGSLYVVPPKSTGFWCDDYSHEDVFVIDEMDGHRMAPTFFNQLVDYEPMNVPSHGSAGHQFTSKYVFITTNYHPKFWWKKRSPAQVKQTMRRIDVIIKLFPPVFHHACPHCATGLCAFHHP